MSISFQSKSEIWKNLIILWDLTCEELGREKHKKFQISDFLWKCIEMEIPNSYSVGKMLSLKEIAWKSIEMEIIVI